jgi:glutathione S-transferase
MMEKLKVYGDSRSGNCYKIQLLCAELDIRYDWQEVDILAGETRTPQFLAMNPNGRIPLLAFSDGRYLAESNAILCYLADGHALAGTHSFARAQILQWMFFEQYSHEPNIATSRFIIRYLGNPASRKLDLEARSAGGYAALSVMEKQLLNHEYMVGESFSIADIALFAYTHVADEGGFDLADYPAIRAWIRKIERRPHYVAMKKV